MALLVIWSWVGWVLVRFHMDVGIFAGVLVVVLIPRFNPPPQKGLLLRGSSHCFPMPPRKKASQHEGIFLKDLRKLMQAPLKKKLEGGSGAEWCEHVPLAIYC